MGYSKPLPIFSQRVHSFFAISKRPRYSSLHSSTPILHSLTAFSGYSPSQVRKKGVHPPHHLYAGSTISGDFVEGQPKEIVPRWKRDDESQFAAAVVKSANFQMPLTHAHEQVFDLVKRLNRSCWIINCR